LLSGLALYTLVELRPTVRVRRRRRMTAAARPIEG
jgi:hypothetical protein